MGVTTTSILVEVIVTTRMMVMMALMLLLAVSLSSRDASAGVYGMYIRTIAYSLARKVGDEASTEPCMKLEGNSTLTLSEHCSPRLRCHFPLG